MAQAETRRLAAIMFTDMVGFPSVVYAVQCAQHVQTQFRAYNTEKETAEQIHVRIGIHLGDIVQRDGDVFGDGVNIASRLQALAEPDTICISHLIYQAVEKKLPLGTVVSLGRPRLKNIAQRFPVYELLPEQPKGVLYQWVKRQHEQAIAEEERAVALDPNNALANFFLADVLGIAGRPAEGIEFVKKAMRLNPRYPVFYANTLGWSYLFLGRHEEAVAALCVCVCGRMVRERGLW